MLPPWLQLFSYFTVDVVSTTINKSRELISSGAFSTTRQLFEINFSDWKWFVHTWRFNPTDRNVSRAQKASSSINTSNLIQLRSLKQNFQWWTKTFPSDFLAIENKNHFSPAFYFSENKLCYSVVLISLLITFDWFRLYYSLPKSEKAREIGLRLSSDSEE